MREIEKPETFSVRLSEAERLLLAAVAKAEGMTEADFVRTTIKDRAVKLGIPFPHVITSLLKGGRHWKAI